MDSQGTIRAEVAALQAAAGMISTAGATVSGGQQQVDAAASSSGAFGGEPAGAAFDSMCGRASDALGELANTLTQLADNTAAASYGYVVTDKGAIPSSLRIVHGQYLPKPPGGP